MTKTATKVIIIRESLKTSIVSDSYTFLTTVALVGVGIVLGSDTLQWIGGFAAICVLGAKATGKGRLTIAEARAKLDEMEREV